MIGQVVVVMVGFVTTPILLRYLGVVRFGAFRAAIDWFGYVGLLEFGVGGALQVLFARALGTDHRAGVIAGVRAGMRAYLLLAGLMVMAAVVLGTAMPWLIRAPGYLTTEVWAGCGISLVAFLWLPLSVFRPLAEAEQRGYLVNLLNTVQLLIVMVASVGFAAFRMGLVGQFLAMAIGGAVFHLSLAYVELRRYPEILGGVVSEPRPALWGLSWPNLLFNLASRLGLLTDNILLAAFLGPAAVTPFVLSQRLIQAMAAQVTAIGGAGWAGLIDLHYRGEHGVFAHRLIQLTRLTAVMGAALLLPMAVWNRDLVSLWVGEKNYAGAAVTWLAAANAWLLAVTSVWGWPLMAGGKVRAVVPTILTSAGVNLAVGTAGTALVGLPGPLLGTLAGIGLVSSWWLLVLIRREFGIGPAGLLRAAAEPGLVAIPYGIGLILLAGAMPAYHPGWPRWACLLSVAGWLTAAALGYFVLAWFLAIPASDRAEWIGRFRGWRRRAVEPIGSGRGVVSQDQLAPPADPEG
jgi:O-antigen/teichoic acid export membrane protein